MVRHSPLLFAGKNPLAVLSIADFPQGPPINCFFFSTDVVNEAEFLLSEEEFVIFLQKSHEIAWTVPD